MTPYRGSERDSVSWWRGRAAPFLLAIAPVLVIVPWTLQSGIERVVSRGQYRLECVGLSWPIQHVPSLRWMAAFAVILAVVGVRWTSRANRRRAAGIVAAATAVSLFVAVFGAELGGRLRTGSYHRACLGGDAGACYCEAIGLDARDVGRSQALFQSLCQRAARGEGEGISVFARSCIYLVEYGRTKEERDHACRIVADRGIASCTVIQPRASNTSEPGTTPH